MKKETTKKEKTSSDIQKISSIKGRAMLEWYGKRTPKSIEWFPAQEKEVYGNMNAKDWNKLFWGDNKQILAHLLKDYRGSVNFVYIDPPFDSKADYVKKVQLNGQRVAGQGQNVLEEMQYTDIWNKDEYLQFMYERLILIRELLAEDGSIALHCDWHRSAHLKLLLDEVFGDGGPEGKDAGFKAEIIWKINLIGGNAQKFEKNHETIFWYTKGDDFTFNKDDVRQSYSKEFLDSVKKDENGKMFYTRGLGKDGDRLNRKAMSYINPLGKSPSDVWTDIEDTSFLTSLWEDKTNYNESSNKNTFYPTQKPEALLERLIKGLSSEGDIVMDCFMGSGTTLAVAQKLNRRWIGCDINKGAIITTTERLDKIIKEQGNKSAFKVYNVNHYDVFNNDIQAKQLLIETYKIDELSRGDFDGTLGPDYVKIISPNRVLSKMDIVQVIDAIKKNKSLFVAKTVSKQKEAIFENKVIVICSGAELDVRDFTKKENNTGVAIEIRDIQIDKKDLDFKKPTEASITYTSKGNVLTIDVKDYYSPLLMKRLELENDGRLSAKERVNVFDYRQAVEHIVIDVNYGEGQKKSKDIAFNAEVFLHKAKKNELVDVSYTHTYEKKGTYTVAVKIVDVLGEEYFETHEVTIK